VVDPEGDPEAWAEALARRYRQRQRTDQIPDGFPASSITIDCSHPPSSSHARHRRWTLARGGSGII
jgi:hypothetical protein